jgi:glycosyltransferase involved in cell wall biosynthesis
MADTMVAQGRQEVRDPRSVSGLRIGVNLFALSLGGGGMRQYVLQLLPWLLRLSAHRFVLFYQLQGWPSLAGMLRRLSAADRGRIQTIEIEDQQDVFAHTDAFDVWFAPLNAFAPDLLDRPSLSTLADIQEHFFPEYFTPEQRRQRGILYPHTARAVTRLLTISEFSRNSICTAFHVPPAKVRAIHLAPNDEIVAAEPQWPRELGEPPARYVFYPANLYPHKGHLLLLDALRLLRDRGVDCACLMTGQPAEPGVDIETEIAARGLEGQTRWLGHVAAPALRFLYENAICLCFPSRFEGFGMPLVEAMLCGCPVIATRATCIPEVVGDAALLVEPTAEAFADAIAGLIGGPAQREELAQRGRAHAERFTAARVAEQTLEAINDAVAAFTPPRPASGTVSFVVQPGPSPRALVDTLASLAFEVEAHDEVLVLAAPEDLDGAAATLCANLGIVRFIRSGNWLDQVRRDLVWVLAAGERVREGATQAVLAALDEASETHAAVGQVLGCSSEGTLTGSRYLPPPDAGAGRWSDVPACGVVWRRDFLRTVRTTTTVRHWPARLLDHAAPDVAILYRTFAVVPEARTGLMQATGEAIVRGLGHLGQPGRALVRHMPLWLKRPLRGLYRRVMRACRGS